LYRESWDKSYVESESYCPVTPVDLGLFLIAPVKLVVCVTQAYSFERCIVPTKLAAARFPAFLASFEPATPFLLPVVIGRLKCLLLALVVCAGFIPRMALTQLAPKPPDMTDTLNREAEANDLAGIHTYSKHLIQMLPGIRSGGDAYADSLTDRLARAEMMARHGKRKLISEIEIAKAFNDLMRQTGAPASLRADLDSMVWARAGWEKQLPALISRERNGTYCDPGESVFILEMLIENVGRPPTPLSSSGPSVIGPAMPPARVHLLQYYASHLRTDDIRLLNDLAKALGI
jgi:hypothetical protein